MSTRDALEGAAPTHAPSRPTAAGLAWAAAGIALALALAGRLVAPVEGSGDFLLYDVSWLAILLAWAVVGALVAARRPHNPIGWLLCGLALLAGLVGLAEGYAERDLADGRTGSFGESAAWLANWAWVPLVAVPLSFVPLYFPDGRLPSRRWRAVSFGAGAAIAAFAFSEAFAAGPLHDYERIVNPYGIDHAAVEVVSAGFFGVLAAVVAAAASLVVRFRRADGVEREQIKWLAYAGTFAAGSLVAAGVIAGLGSEHLANALILLGVLSLPLAVGIAVLRHRLYDIDVLINRTLVYGGLTVGVVAIYVLVVGGLAALFHESADLWLALVATGIIALLVQPLRATLQRRVNRLMYGEDGRASSGLRSRLHEAFVPEAAELQRARRRLVAAREEERRRLRRDLHDGLGPALAGAALKVEAAENLLASDPAAARSLLEDARTEIQHAVADVRGLVYALRPPALDELGLVKALREQAAKLGAAERPRIEIEAPEPLPPLPAAVEVAAYRISLEAMTNATRHADAQRCVVRIALNGDLELEVADDGRGLPHDLQAGVGTSSMRERAEELGGSCQIEPLDGRGTRVVARLPLGSA